MATVNNIDTVVENIQPAYAVVPAGIQLQFGVAPLAVTVTPLTIERDGGYELSVVVGGLGLPAGTYNVFLGPLGTTSDPSCYSGVSGQGNVVTVANNQFTCISPILPIGGLYEFTFVNLTSLVEDISEPAVTVVAHLVRSGTLKYRQLLPRNWHMGYRGIENLEFPQV